MDVDKIETLIVADFTVDGLARCLNARVERPLFSATSAPFDQVQQVLLNPSHDAWNSRPGIVIVWTRAEAAIRSFHRLREGEQVAVEEIEADVDDFANVLRTGAANAEAFVVPTWVQPAFERGLGLLDRRPGQGLADAIARMNIRLADALADISNIYLVDTARWLAAAGPKSRSAKLWHIGKMAFTNDLFEHASADVASAAAALAGQSRKLIVLDLDDTLWGGVVGDDGQDNLVLGGPNPVGEAFQSFQAALRRLKNKGILLAIISKNEERTALEALASHDEMILRPDDFAGWRINWRDKARNMAELLEELGLLPHSVVYIDDNPVERARVQDVFPEILVPEWPDNKMLYESALNDLACFDTGRFSDEDKSRNESYVIERKRREVRQSLDSIEDWLKSLDIKIAVEPLDENNIGRVVQLLNKTNQMNLRTRRSGADELLNWSGTEGHAFYAFRVSDKFGDYGLVGLASLVESGEGAAIEDFVVSCRVIGRGVEKTMLHVLVEHARENNLPQVLAKPIPTRRNEPCIRFFEDDSGWVSSEAADGLMWNTSRHYPAPDHIQI